MNSIWSGAFTDTGTRPSRIVNTPHSEKEQGKDYSKQISGISNYQNEKEVVDIFPSRWSNCESWLGWREIRWK